MTTATMRVTEADLLRGYQSAAVEYAVIAQDHALRVAVTERIVELIAYRRWYRQNRWADWSVERREHEVELRALLRVARTARRASRAALGPATGQSFHDWQAR